MVTKEDIVDDNTNLYNQCLSIIALNAPSMIRAKNTEELYQIACRGGAGSEIAIKRLKQIYPEHKMTNETIHQAVQELRSGEDDSSLKYGPIEFWDVSGVTDMNSLFDSYHGFNEDISRWSVSSVTTMDHMFFYCCDFNSDISKWSVSSVTTMKHMFCYCKKFNSDISNWNVSNVTDMRSMFCHCYQFNRDLSQWSVSSVTTMHAMFYCCSKFNSDLSKWSVSSVTNAGNIFDNCYSLKLEFKPIFK